jgi:hypothetical protein
VRIHILLSVKFCSFSLSQGEMLKSGSSTKYVRYSPTPSKSKNSPSTASSRNFINRWNRCNFWMFVLSLRIASDFRSQARLLHLPSQPDTEFLPTQSLPSSLRLGSAILTLAWSSSSPSSPSAADPSIWHTESSIPSNVTQLAQADYATAHTNKVFCQCTKLAKISLNTYRVLSRTY